jgi:hypothetical protein
VKPTIGEELKEWLTEYRSPDIRFPEEGNEQQEHLADQIDQRVWSYMYGPGMQLFLQRVDDRVASGISLFSAIEKGHEERLQAFEAHHETERATLQKSLAGTQRVLWGLGGLCALGTGAFATITLWPKIKEFFRRKKSKQVSGDTADRDQDGKTTKEEPPKNYFKWKRDRSSMITLARS